MGKLPKPHPSLLRMRSKLSSLKVETQVRFKIDRHTMIQESKKRPMTKHAATVAALFLTPIIPGGIFAVFFFATYDLTDFSLILAMWPIGYIFGVWAVLIFGVPALLLGVKLSLIRWWSVAIVGFAIGALVSIILRLWGDWRNPEMWSHETAYSIAILGATGTASAIFFWLIWRLGQKRNGEA